MTARDRLATARQSSNLTDSPDRLTDVSVLAAAGMVASSNAVGMSLMRLRDTMDRHEWPYCLSATAARARKFFAKRNDKPSEREIHDLSERILRAWVAPTCPVCDGRGHKKIAGTPLMEDEPCGVCHGAGVLPIDYGLAGGVAEASRFVAAWLDKCAADAAHQTRIKVYG